MMQPKTDLEEVLNAVMVEEPEPNYDVLLRWSERYPEHREALARFFATWAIQREMPTSPSIDESQLASLAVSKALNILNQQESRTSAANRKAQENRLLGVCRAAGISAQQLADRVGLDQSIIAKLDLRRISEIPQICVKRIADALHTSVDSVRPLITGPPLLPAGARYKSRTRPRPEMEDFAASIRSSSLSRDLQKFWLDAVAQERERS